MHDYQVVGEYQLITWTFVELLYLAESWLCLLELLSSIFPCPFILYVIFYLYLILFLHDNVHQNVTMPYICMLHFHRELSQLLLRLYYEPSSLK